MEERVGAIEGWIEMQGNLLETTNNELAAMNRHFGTCNEGFEANNKTVRALVASVEKLDSRVFMIEKMQAQVGVDQKKHTEMLLGLNDRLDKVDERFGKVDQRLDKLDERFDKMDERFTAQDLKLAKMDGKLDVLLELLSRKLT